MELPFQIAFQPQDLLKNKKIDVILYLSNYIVLDMMHHRLLGNVFIYIRKLTNASFR